MIATVMNQLIDRSLVPEAALRAGIRALCLARLRQLRSEPSHHNPAAFAAAMRSMPIAIATDSANEQHYEVPPRFYELVLGKHRKYSSAYWPTGVNTLDEAELAMLELTAARADIRDGQRILELGCGWGSFTLWAAARYRRSTVVGVSNSHQQREAILAMARERGLDNIDIVTANLASAQLPAGPFDRIVSIEMFEHMRNWEALLSKAAQALGTDGKMFIHVFAHRTYAYAYDDNGPSDWMAREFFSGGIMPAVNLLAEFDRDLYVDQSWTLSGEHYGKTSECWYENLMARRSAVLELFRSSYGTAAEQRFERWRVFFLACAELFSFRSGTEWVVAHYRLLKRS